MSFYVVRNVHRGEHQVPVINVAKPTGRQNEKWVDPLRVSFLALTLWLAFGLRLFYVCHVSPFVDEYISMLAMQSIVEQGAPVLPSGLFYGPKAILHSYLGALAFWMFGPSEFVARFPSVLIGVATVGCVYRAGRDWFSPTVGLLAAVALAWLPSAVEWGGRARMYTQWQLLSLIGGYLLISSYVKNTNHWARVAGVLVLLLAVFTHSLALIVFGGLLAGVTVSWLISLPGSVRRLSRWEAWVGLVLIVTTIGFLSARPWGPQLSLSIAAQGLMDIQERVLYLLAFTHQFVTWPLWPLTILYVIGFITLLLRLIRKSPISGDRVALALYILILFAWLATSVFSAFHDDRYLFGIIPFYLSLAFRAFWLLIEVILASLRLPLLRTNVLAASIVASLLVIALLAPNTMQLLGEDPYGFAPAFLHVRDSWRSGDAVSTCSPAASQLFLGRTDYYVIQYGAASYGGVDVWTGAPLINTPEKFAAILDNRTRVWLVVEKLCWERHFDTRFQEVVEQNMQSVFDQKGMMVFVSNSG
jgi:4-amino-4-deoxy-L-arabinose transferase-like glycosyltransferase